MPASVSVPCPVAVPFDRSTVTADEAPAKVTRSSPAPPFRVSLPKPPLRDVVSCAAVQNVVARAAAQDVVPRPAVQSGRKATEITGNQDVVSAQS